MDAASFCASRPPVSTLWGSRPTAPLWRPLRPASLRQRLTDRTGAGSAAQGTTSARPAKAREGRKQAALVEMLKRPKGATIDETVAATGWQPHTVRGAFAGALKKRLGLSIISEEVEGRGRVYRIAG